MTYSVGMVAPDGRAENRKVLLTNPAIAGEEPGRVVFVPHGSRDAPDQFRIDEIRESEDLVGAHGSKDLS